LQASPVLHEQWSLIFDLDNPMNDKPMQESDNQSSNSEPPHQKVSVSRAAVASLGFGILIFIPFHSVLAI
jgi:hypothetical protein